MSAQTPFRILSLDGGGIRGTFTAAFLAQLEETTGKRIVDHFDLIAGTSTGGIIATSLVLGVPASKILEFYEREGPSIFTRRETRKRFRILHPLRSIMTVVADLALREIGLDWDQVCGVKYESKRLRAALEELLGEQKLDDARTRLVVPAVDLSNGQPTVFKTPHLADACTRDLHYRGVDVALATASAPTFFPHTSIGEGSAYCDGGLWANNPSMVAFVEAQRIGIPRNDVEMLSIGTGKSRYSIVPPGADAGLYWWMNGGRVMDVMSLSQSFGTNAMAEFLLADRIVRVDYELPDQTWNLGCVGNIDRLVHFGREAAHCEVGGLTAKFFGSPIEPYARALVA